MTYQSALRSTLAAIVLAVSACGSITGDGDRVPKLGRYSYTGSHPNSTGFSARSWTGVMIISAASADEITVRWEVDGFESAAPLPGGWNSDAYLAYAKPSVGTINHRVSRDGNTIRCAGQRYGVFPQGLLGVPVTCSLSYLGN